VCPREKPTAVLRHALPANLPWPVDAGGVVDRYMFSIYVYVCTYIYIALSHDMSTWP